MELKQLFTDDDAVSPVIGVILMVAITVILAAVIGAFVLNIGGSQEEVPSASYEFNHDGTNAVVVHQGGGGIDTDTLSLAGDANVANTDMVFSDVTDRWTAGEEIKGDGSFSEGDTVELVWSSTSGDTSQIIGEGTAQ